MGEGKRILVNPWVSCKIPENNSKIFHEAMQPRLPACGEMKSRHKQEWINQLRQAVKAPGSASGFLTRNTATVCQPQITSSLLNKGA